jgi:hypothetical protein
MESILQTNNPDKHIEYFWITFKEQLKLILTDDERIEIDQISLTLNNLQKEQKYKEIENYIYNHIEQYGWHVIKNQNLKLIRYLSISLKRWKKISQTKFNTREFYIIFDLYNFIILNYTKEERIYTVINNLSNYLDDREKNINVIFNIFLEENKHGLIDKIKSLINFKKLYPNKNINKNINKMCGRKICNLIKNL